MQPDVLVLDEPTSQLDPIATEDFLNTVRRINRELGCTVIITEHRLESVFSHADRVLALDEGRVAAHGTPREVANALYATGDDMTLALPSPMRVFYGVEKMDASACPLTVREGRTWLVERVLAEPPARVSIPDNPIPEPAGDPVVELRDVWFRYERTRPDVLRDASLRIGRGIVFALVGGNGTGKSTLLRCITGEETPDRGWIHLGPAVKSAYLPQLVRFDDPSRNMVDTMLWEAKCDPQTARNRLAAFGFRGEDVFKTVSVLSGGEQSRLRLCILMRDDIDEPTNHLDLLSREWMEDALMDYSEALLFVSHDRWFIEKFATRIWCLHDGQIEDYRGGFAEWREYKARQEALQPPAKAAKSAAREEKPKKKTEPNRDRRRQKIERDIERAEASLRDIEAEMEKNASDYQKLLELGAQKDAAEESLGTLYAEWETLAE